MEVSDYLSLTPEQKQKRHSEWKERQNQIAAGEDPEEIKLNRRAKKALFLLKSEYNGEGKTKLSDGEIEILKAIVVEYCSSDLYFFSKYVLDFDLLTRETHKRWADNLLGTIDASKKRVMRLKPRGTFKTTIYGVGFTLWLWACQSPQIRIFYTSSNALLLGEVSDKINQYVGDEKADTFFSFVFGIVKDSVAKNTSDVFNIKGRSGKGFSLILRTSGGSTVGIHPNVVIIDDPCDQKDRESEAVREQKKRWLDSVTPLLVPFVSPRSKFLFKTIFYIGTVWHMQDLTYHIAKMNKKLKGMMKWDIEIESIYNDKGGSSYPEFIDDEEIEAIRSSISEEFFACQYMNKALPVGLQIFNMDKLSFAREDQVDIKEGQILCIFDPSLGKAHSDYPAVWWLHKLGDNLTFIEALDKKIELSLIVNVIAAKNVELGCREMVYEDNGVMLVGQALEKAHKRVHWHMEINSVHHSSNKHERIVSIQPDLYSGYVRFMEDYEERYPEAMNQIIFYPAYGHDDFPDAAHMGIEYFRQDHFKFHVYTELL